VNEVDSFTITANVEVKFKKICQYVGVKTHVFADRADIGDACQAENATWRKL
jgi:hypothetical protein